MDKEPKYCRFCGAELQRNDAGNVQIGFDQYTGKPLVLHRIVFRCPNEQKAYTEFDPHDVFSLDTPVQ